MTQRHKFADVLIAIAEGKTVQFNSLIYKDEWHDYVPDVERFSPLYCENDYEWRVKPEVKKIKIVTYINLNTDKIVTSFHAENYNVEKEHLVNLQFRNEVVLEVPPDTYNYYVG